MADDLFASAAGPGGVHDAHALALEGLSRPETHRYIADTQEWAGGKQMRAISFTGAVGALLALGGCGSQHDRLVSQIASQCAAQIRQQTGELIKMLPNFDPQRFCTCAASAMAEGKTDDQLREIQQNQSAGNPMDQNNPAMARCAQAEGLPGAPPQ